MRPSRRFVTFAFLNSHPQRACHCDDGKPDISVMRDDEGNLTGAVYYQYSDDGTPIVEKEYDAKGMLSTKTVYAAVERGCVKSVFTIKREDNDVYNGYILDEIDDSGQAKKETEYTVTGVVDHYSYLEYNEKGQVSRETVYSPYDVITGYYDHLYDVEGRESELLQYDANNVPMGKTTWEYDELDRIVKESYFMKEVCRAYNEYEYREDGSYIMTAYTLIDETTMTYDKKVMNN